MGQKKSATLGLHFFYNDFPTAYQVKTTSLKNVLSNNLWTKMHNMQDGLAVTERDYAGQFLLVYFGFTYCPDVCPTELGRIADVIDALGPAGARVTPVLITIDPQRDTPAAMADYVSRFHPRMHGLTGTPEQVRAVASRYRVYFARAQNQDTTHYVMDHSSFVYLVGPDGQVQSLFRPETSVEEMARGTAVMLRRLTSS